MRLIPGQSETVKLLQPKLKFDGEPVIEVLENEIYSFKASPGKTWTDSGRSSAAIGFFNPLLLNILKRVKNAKCFELCGTINQNEKHHFRIGEERLNYPIPVSGNLYFFPNDNLYFYFNNAGYMNVLVSREK